jgi:hypothetical protein
MSLPVYLVGKPATYGRDDINKILIPYRKESLKPPSFPTGFIQKRGEET